MFKRNMTVNKVLQLIIFVIFCAQSILAHESLFDLIKDTEIVLAFLVHRHGDRTPLSPDFSFSNRPEALKKIVEKYGYGELTPRGKYRGYQIGQFIRRRYSSLLSCQYNESEIYIRSTDFTRTKMTALTSMAAVYPATVDNWSSDINWTPVPYTTVPMEIDSNQPVVSCPKYFNYYTTESTLTPYQSIFNTWSSITGLNLSDPVKIYTIYDNYYCQRSLGFPLSDALEAIFPEIEKVAAAAMDAAFGNQEYLHLLVGMLLNEFFEAASTLISGGTGPRLRVYSAHDLNVYGMMAASLIPLEERRGVPGYGAVFSLELRRVKKTGQYGVLPVYLPDPNTTELYYPPIKGCGTFCDFDIFRNITSVFVLDEKTWKEKCNEN